MAMFRTLCTAMVTVRFTIKIFHKAKVQTYSKQIDKFFNIENEFWHMLLLFFLSVLEDNYSLQVTLLDYQYQKDYENLNSAPAQELISKFVAEVITISH